MSASLGLSSPATLSSSEGALVCVSIHVDPRYLEALLEALAHVEFPINPQIYHEAEIVPVYADGHEEPQSVTLVEFPAYAGRLDEVYRALEAYGFDRSSVQVTGMLDELRAQCVMEPAPPGAPYVRRYRRKLRGAAQ
jgi:hypothetical protein